MRKVSLPKNLKLNFITSIINDINFIFYLDGKEENEFILDLKQINKVDIVGIIVLFKFIEYSVSKKCFKNPLIEGQNERAIAEAIKFYGFDNLLKDYVKERNVEKSLLSLEIKEKDSFLVAPQALIRNSPQSKNNFDKRVKIELEKFYNINAGNSIETILQCTAEISSNFFNHAEKDTKSIILAKGNKDYFEIVSSDTSEGILNTLRRNVKYKNYNDYDLLNKAFEKEVTCKPDSNHMGFGLWLLSEVTKEYNGILEVLTDNLRFTIKSGKTKVSQIPFWKGTIVYLKIPILINGINIGKILIKNREDLGIKININFRNN